MIMRGAEGPRPRETDEWTDQARVDTQGKTRQIFFRPHVAPENEEGSQQGHDDSRPDGLTVSGIPFAQAKTPHLDAAGVRAVAHRKHQTTAAIEPLFPRNEQPQPGRIVSIVPFPPAAATAPPSHLLHVPPASPDLGSLRRLDAHHRPQQPAAILEVGGVSDVHRPQHKLSIVFVADCWFQ